MAKPRKRKGLKAPPTGTASAPDATATPADVPLPEPYRFIPAGPGRPIRPARILPGTFSGPPVVRPEDIKVVWCGPKRLTPSMMRFLVELELELVGGLVDSEDRMPRRKDPPPVVEVVVDSDAPPVKESEVVEALARYLLAIAKEGDHEQGPS